LEIVEADKSRGILETRERVLVASEEERLVADRAPEQNP
jgi:hypothetical protein